MSLNLTAMNFYIVPAGLYQTQQKLKKKLVKKRSSNRSSRNSTTSDKTDSHSLMSSTTYGDSVKSLPHTPEVQSLLDLHQSKADCESHGGKATSSLSASADSRLHNFAIDQASTPTSLSAMKLHEHDKSLKPRWSGESHSSRRDSSMSFASSHASSKMTSHLGRKMSYSQVPTASLASQVPPGYVDIRPDLFSSGRSSDNFAHKPHFQVPKFRPITDLSVLNSEYLLNKNFYNPSFMIARYNYFLQVLSEHHLNDSMNFAAVRDHSLLKFINRHSISKLEREKSRSIKSTGDIRYYEGLLSYELLKCRCFLRRLINLQSKEIPNRGNTISCEELLQVNFINYVRYLLNLPNVLPVSPDHLDEILAKHYQFRAFFSEMSSALYSLKKEGYADDIPTPASDVDILVDAITKVSFEFTLLEKYVIHILVKLNHNFIIENRIVKHLFSLFDLNMKLEKRESLKVLNFNTYFSSQYSWYLAITIPFVRVFEANIYGENPKLISDYDTYQSHLSTTSGKRKNFKTSDSELFDAYFNRIDVKDWEMFLQMSRKDLVELQKNSCRNSDTYENSTSEAGGIRFKPPNFEYLTSALSSIESETFHVIQSRDISLQLSPSNFKVIISEFHRLLKKGGVLELPLFRSGDGHIQDLARSGVSKFPNQSKFMDLEVATTFDLIPHLLESLFAELGNLFGSKNVKFSSVLLSAKNDMNNFLIKHTALSVYEIYGDVDGYCSRFAREGDTNADEKDCLHYFFYIRAEKA